MSVLPCGNGPPGHRADLRGDADQVRPELAPGAARSYVAANRQDRVESAGSRPGRIQDWRRERICSRRATSPAPVEPVPRGGVATQRQQADLVVVRGPDGELPPASPAHRSSSRRHRPCRRSLLPGRPPGQRGHLDHHVTWGSSFFMYRIAPATTRRRMAIGGGRTVLERFIDGVAAGRDDRARRVALFLAVRDLPLPRMAPPTPRDWSPWGEAIVSPKSRPSLARVSPDSS